MPHELPCPNPSCTHVFTAAQVQAATALKCPRCGQVFQFRHSREAAPAAGQAPAAGRLAAPAPLAKAPPPVPKAKIPVARPARPAPVSAPAVPAAPRPEPIASPDPTPAGFDALPSDAP